MTWLARLRRRAWLLILPLLLLLIAGWIASYFGCLALHSGVSHHLCSLFFYRGSMRLTHKTLTIPRSGLSYFFMADDDEDAGGVLWDYPVNGGTGTSDERVVFHIPWALDVYQGNQYDLNERTGLMTTTPVVCAEIPLLLPTLLTILFLALSFADWYRRRRTRLIGRCPQCAYDLRAHKPGDNCPECGSLIPKVPKT